ncbi:hypothetical protein ACGF5F_29510 [Streptomyces sp. NPDC047821]|uniref:hypothetical protein n=1 Tax=Streptomyces sp. NPDC047821 TaxID=3365488 RepID=UPI00371E1E8B
MTMGFLITLLVLLAGAAPQCAEEDGSTQRVCVWSDGTGDTVLNIDNGTYWFTLGGE